MGYNVSSWFIDQLQSHNSSPKRILTVNGSDFSARINRWPRIKFNDQGIQSVKLTIELNNIDGAFNTFYHSTYTMPGTCTFDFGFTHPTSGDELIRLYTGEIKQIAYTQKTCSLQLRDRAWKFAERVIGESGAPVEFTAQIPSDIAWTVCTCYGGLSTVQNSTNPDIHWGSFLEWAAVFSTDSIELAARFDGKKTVKALKSVADMTDSVIWADGYGRIKFKRYTEPTSLDFIITIDEQMDMVIDIDDLSIVNRQIVSMDYSPDSNYWANNVISISSSSVNSFGLRESILQDETVWYVDSYSALNMATRRTNLLRNPPRKFDIKSVLVGVHRELGETLRVVDSFYNITSSSGWRFVSMEIDTDTGLSQYSINEAAAMNAFYLDESYLDSDSYLL